MDNKQAYKILGNISIDYSDLSQEQADQMDEALDHAFRALEELIKQEDEMKRWKANNKPVKEIRLGSLRMCDLFIFEGEIYQAVGMGDRDPDNVNCINVETRQTRWFDVDDVVETVEVEEEEEDEEIRDKESE